MNGPNVMDCHVVMVVIASMCIQGSYSASVEVPRVGQCVTSCRGVASGNYQSCDGCDVYITCDHGMVIGPRPCPAGTSYDDRLKQCIHVSTTCEVSTGPGCINSCSGLRDGHYQSCQSCYSFIVCSGGNIYKQTCPANVEWDDAFKTCTHASSTCQLTTEIPVQTTTHLPLTTTRLPPTTTRQAGIEGGEPSICVESCDGLPAGDYQSCYTCNGYVTCAGYYPVHRPCPANLVWDDNKKICDYTSSTCDPTDFLTTTTTEDPVTSSGDDSEIVFLYH